MQVYPIEVDEALLAHPDVEQAVTFPVPDAKFDSVVSCAVVLRSGVSVRARDLKWFAATHLASYKVPQRILLLDSIPDVPRRALARALGFNSSARPSSVFAIQPQGCGSPLFVVGAPKAFELRSARPVFGIREPDPNLLPPPHTLEHAAAECIHALRRFQPDGPYLLGAFGASRAVAFEMARQLEQVGERVDFVALLHVENADARLPYDRRHSWPGGAVAAGLLSAE